MPGPMMNIPSAAMPMVGPTPSVEDQAKMMFSQRAAQTMVQAAQQDAALQQQLALTRYARAHTKVKPQKLVLPENAAYGMTEDGRPIRAHPSKTNIWLQGPDVPNPTDSAISISKYGARPEDFLGMGFDDIANTIASIPTQMDVAALDRREAQRGREHGRNGTLPAFLPSNAIVSESGPLPLPDQGSTGKGPKLQFPVAPAGERNPVPGSPMHPVERMFGHLDDTVREGGYPALVAAHPDMVMGAIAHQLEARRMRDMGMWDPTYVSGGSI